MSENLQALLKEALLNNSYDYDDLHESIKEVWQSSYSYLYYLQKAKVGYEEFHYFSNDTISRDNSRIGDLHLNKSLFACFSIDYDCIGYYREPYRTSEYYTKEFTFEDMIYNPHIFYKIPLVIIDDKVIYDYKVRIHVDSTEFTLPFKRNFVLEEHRNSTTDDIIYKDHKIQVLMIDNIYYQRFTYNKHTIQFNEYEKVLKISKRQMRDKSDAQITRDVKAEFMEEHNIRSISELSATQLEKINKEIQRRLKVIELPKKTGKFFLSLHLPNDYGKTYELGTQMIELYDDEENGLFIANLTDDIVELVRDQYNDIYASIIFINELYSHTFYHGSQVTSASNDGADIMVIEESERQPYACPIPVENFMIFKMDNDSSGWVLQQNVDILDMYYPNIYIINEDNMSEGDQYKIYYFYNKVPDLKYTCLFDFYFKFLSDIFEDKSMEEIINDVYYDRYEYGYTDDEKIIFKRVFNKILGYMDYHYRYGDMDFVSRYLKDVNNFDKVPIEYKDETFKQWIKESPWILRDYVNKQNEVGASYHLFANTLDLESRLRTSTEPDLGTKDMYEFDEPRYVFGFANERDYPDMLDCRLFVDGILVGDVYQRRKLFTDYFYVPQSYVKEDSYIELEVFPRYTYDEYFELQSMDDAININIAEPTENISPTAADLIVWEDKRETRREELRDLTRIDFKKVTVSGGLLLDPRYTTFEADIPSDALRLEATVGVNSDRTQNYAVICFYDTDGNIFRPALNMDYSDALDNGEGSYICDVDVPEGAKKVRVTTVKDIVDDPTIYLDIEIPDDGHPKARFDTSMFKLVSKYARGNFEVSSDNPDKPVKFTRLSKFEISANHPDAVGKKFKMSFKKVPIMVRFTIDRPGYAYIDTHNDNFNYSTEYIRVFRNGRLVPKIKYRLLTGYETPRILFMEWFDVGDIVYIDITPYRYTQIYHKKNLTKRDALIDLRGVINKPFDIRYYDVYLNGRKLSLNNVFAITPWLITLVNMKSNYNLDIYEKERDWEYFGLDYTETDYYFSFEELIRSGIVHDEEYCKLVKDRIDELKDPRLIIHPNEFIEEPLDYEETEMKYPIFYTFYYDELVPKTYVDPDENQFNIEFMQSNFTEIMDYYRTHPKDFARNQFELDRKRRYGDVLMLDPDTFIESEMSKASPLYMQFKDKFEDDHEYDENDNVILDVNRDPRLNTNEEYGGYGNDIYDDDGMRLTYGMDNNLYEDPDDQPLIPDGVEYLRLRDRMGDDGWYYDEYGRLIIDSERTSRIEDIYYSLDGQVYEDDLTIALMNGAWLIYGVGHMDEVPQEYLNMGITKHPENSIDNGEE